MVHIQAGQGWAKSFPLPRRLAAAVRLPPGLPGPPTTLSPAGLLRTRWPAPPSMVLPSRAGQGYVSVVKVFQCVEKLRFCCCQCDAARVGLE